MQITHDDLLLFYKLLYEQQMELRQCHAAVASLQKQIEELQEKLEKSDADV